MFSCTYESNYPGVFLDCSLAQKNEPCVYTMRIWLIIFGICINSECGHPVGSHQRCPLGMLSSSICDSPTNVLPFPLFSFFTLFLSSFNLLILLHRLIILRQRLPQQVQRHFSSTLCFVVWVAFCDDVCGNSMVFFKFYFSKCFNLLYMIFCRASNASR